VPTPSKKAKKMPNYDAHAKYHFFMPNNFKKALKMPTWQPWSGIRGKSTHDFSSFTLLSRGKK